MVASSIITSSPTTTKAARTPDPRRSSSGPGLVATAAPTQINGPNSIAIPSSPPHSDGLRNGGGLAIGIVLGVLFFLCLCMASGWWAVMRKGFGRRADEDAAGGVESQEKEQETVEPSRPSFFDGQRSDSWWSITGEKRLSRVQVVIDRIDAIVCEKESVGRMCGTQ
ncbi:hypothetical protein BC938DRAFT_473494 [Jimgerdemannia flammicorona]|uniref:Uncharacterized protein n=1 Tax=Jimgerdemannia flammicorona TaxID=994334 RepID=A0A433QTC9_9FUNG|nr:hypothetical protein BC938DRAFT_473494 [Jimgerdemannia flammicorona]